MSQFDDSHYHFAYACLTEREDVQYWLRKSTSWESCNYRLECCLRLYEINQRIIGITINRSIDRSPGLPRRGLR